MTFPDKKTVDRVRAEYPPGTIGKVIGVDDTASLLVEWQTGSSLNVLYGIDQVKKL